MKLTSDLFADFLKCPTKCYLRSTGQAGTSKLTAKSHYLKPLRPDVGRAYFGLKKGERHPIEPGYNAEQYGVNPDAPAGNDQSEKIVYVKFDAHCG
jgi:hypothetical protein